MTIKRKLWKIIDNLELVSMPNYFDDVARTIHLQSVIKDLKELVKEFEDN